MKTITAHFKKSGVKVAGHFKHWPGEGRITSEGPVEELLEQLWSSHPRRLCRTFYAEQFERWARSVAKHVGEDLDLHEEGEWLVIEE